MEIEWKRRLHAGGQIEAFHHPARFKVLACGTRWGKTHLAANIAIDFGLKNSKLPIWWVAPTYELSEVGREKIKEVGMPELFGKENKVRRILPMITGSYAQFKSSDNPDSLLAKAVGILIVDECARISNDIWHSYLRRTLLDHKGPAILISSPKGRNWFYDLWIMGKDSLNKEYQSFHYPTWFNPVLDKEEIEKIKNTTPEMVYRQEYGAEFLDDASTVFRNVDACANGQFKEPEKGKLYVVGVDVAKHQDFWVNTIMESHSRMVVGFYRSQKLDWKFQTDRTESQAKKYNNARIIIDSTGVGDPIYEDLDRRGCDVTPYHFTEQTKRQLVENLALSIERQMVSYPQIDILLDELKSYECERLTSGKLKYSPSSGKTDDCIMSLALCAWELRHNPEDYKVRLIPRVG